MFLHNHSALFHVHQHYSQFIASELFSEVLRKHTRKSVSCFGLCISREKLGSFPLTSAQWNSSWSQLRNWILMHLYAGFNIWLPVVTARPNLSVKLRFSNHKQVKVRTDQSYITFLSEQPEHFSHKGRSTTHTLIHTESKCCSGPAWLSIPFITSPPWSHAALLK